MPAFLSSHLFTLTLLEASSCTPAAPLPQLSSHSSISLRKQPHPPSEKGLPSAESSLEEGLLGRGQPRVCLTQAWHGHQPVAMVQVRSGRKSRHLDGGPEKTTTECVERQETSSCLASLWQTDPLGIRASGFQTGLPAGKAFWVFAALPGGSSTFAMACHVTLGKSLQLAGSLFSFVK